MTLFSLADSTFHNLKVKAVVSRALQLRSPAGPFNNQVAYSLCAA
jgi:hypothetical protein